jgi:hypothetical protein
MHFDWSAFCRLVRSLPEVEACDDAELHKMLGGPVPPLKHTDEFGRPLLGSSLISEHPEPPNYRRIIDIRHRFADDGDVVRNSYFGRLDGFLKSHSELSRIQIVCLSTERECYEVVYFPEAAAAFFFPVRHLEERKHESSA